MLLSSFEQAIIKSMEIGFKQAVNKLSMSSQVKESHRKANWKKLSTSSKVKQDNLKELVELNNKQGFNGSLFYAIQQVAYFNQLGLQLDIESILTAIWYESKRLDITKYDNYVSKKVEKNKPFLSFNNWLALAVKHQVNMYFWKELVTCFTLSDYQVIASKRFSNLRRISKRGLVLTDIKVNVDIDFTYDKAGKTSQAVNHRKQAKTRLKAMKHNKRLVIGASKANGFQLVKIVNLDCLTELQYNSIDLQLAKSQDKQTLNHFQQVVLVPELKDNQDNFIFSFYERKLLDGLLTNGTKKFNMSKFASSNKICLKTAYNIKEQAYNRLKEYIESNKGKLTENRKIVDIGYNTWEYTFTPCESSQVVNNKAINWLESQVKQVIKVKQVDKSIKLSMNRYNNNFDYFTTKLLKETTLTCGLS